MLWYVRSARKVYQKQGYLKRDFVWYTRDGKEQPLSGNEVTANETTKSVIKIREYEMFDNFNRINSS